MAEFGMKRNASGYKDETAYKAMMGMMKPGDVWTVREGGGGLVLIIKNQGNYCNCLTLLETKKNENMMDVISGSTTYWTNPGMIRYLFNERMGAFVQRIPADEFELVTEAVGYALGFDHRNGQQTADTARVMRTQCHELLDRILDGTGAK